MFSTGAFRLAFTCVMVTGAVLAYTLLPSSLGPDLSYSNSQELKEFNGGICARWFLSKSGWKLRKGDTYEEWKKESNKFKANTGGDSQGCMGLAWNKRTWDDGHWKGVIKYEWFYQKGEEAIYVNGFYDSTITEADPTDQKDDNDKNNWKATYLNTNKREKAKLMWQKNKDIEANILKKPRLLGNNDKWDFDASKKCTEDKCKGKELKREHGEGKWRWDKSSDNKGESFDHWHEKFLEIFSYLFDGEGNTLSSLKPLLKDEKGDWDDF